MNPNDIERQRLFCFGYGYTADYLGHELQNSDTSWTIGGTTRDEDRKNELLSRRVRARIYDEEHPLADPETLLNRLTHLLISVPPNADGDPIFNQYAAEISQLKNLKWLGYLSSTAVYGDRDGGTVSETSEARPNSARGSKRYLAEKQWLSLYERYNIPVHIFRLTGIYGPGRSALDSVRAGMARRIEKPNHKFNRIQVEDIVQSLRYSFEKPNPGAIYNLADDVPAPSHEIIGHACDLLGQRKPPIIPYEEANLAPITLSFYNDNKHVSNNKIKTELGVQLKYPDYKTGLQACLDAENFATKEKNK